jgi:DNA-binding transcriptional regulator YiaG
MEEKTTIAVFRNSLGLSATQFADLIDQTLVTFKQLESGELALAKKLQKPSQHALA